MKLDIAKTSTARVLVEAFGPAVFAIGGPVRDKLREAFHGVPYEPKDSDYVVTGVAFDAVRERLTRIGKVDLVGASFGVFKLTIPGEPTVDVAVPRRERSTGWGHRDFVVESGPGVTLEEDQSRRDFLMNAVAVQLSTGDLIAHPGAIEDIRAKRITAINGRQSFLDDPLRILRAAQFAARFGFDIEAGTFARMAECAELVRTVSPERINEELSKMLLKAPRPSDGIRILLHAGLLPMTIPGLETCIGVEQNDFHAFDVFEHSLATLDVSRATLEARWSTLLHDVGKPQTRSQAKGKYGYTFYNHDQVGAGMTERILTNLRYPNRLIDRVTRLVRHHMYNADPSQSDAAIKRLVNRIGIDLLDDQFHLRACDRLGSGHKRRDSSKTNAEFELRVAAILATRHPLEIKDLVINGNDVANALFAAGVTQKAGPGRKVGLVLGALRDRVIEQPELNERQILLSLVARMASEHPELGGQKTRAEEPGGPAAGSRPPADPPGRSC